ncbi:MAG: ABC transporter substrate binding protein [Pseudomonadota bacterium]
MRRAVAAGSGIALSSGPLLALGAEPPRAIMVLVPDIGEPFRSVFASIVEGIESRAPGRVSVLAVGPSNEQGLADEVRRREARVVVALGRQGLKALALLAGGVNAIAGCVVSVQESDLRGHPVYTLAPDPGLLFAHLRRLMPGVRRVSVVYDPRQSGWLIRRAREAARGVSLELDAHEAQDLPAALRHYQQILAAADASRDAVWLPQDATTVEEGAVLPLVLKASWNHSLAVFSSNVAHVKRGALFALYPDNGELGRTLGDAALRALQGGKPAEGVLPLRDVRSAINARTAAHLGIVLGTRIAGYDLVYPEP